MMWADGQTCALLWTAVADKRLQSLFVKDSACSEEAFIWPTGQLRSRLRAPGELLCSLQNPFMPASHSPSSQLWMKQGVTSTWQVGQRLQEGLTG